MCSVAKFYVKRWNVQEVKEIKYLGHIISNDLTDDADIRRQCKMLNIQGNVLLRKFHMCSMYVKLALFRCYCLPMYTAQLWWNHKQYTINRLLITYHNVFKMCLGLSKYESTSMLCALTNIPCCQAVIQNLIFRFICRLQKSNNAILQAIQGSSLVFTSRIRQYWRTKLYVHV